MSTHLPRLFLTRHGDTPWTESRQHTGRTDLALNERGEHNARQIGERLRKNYTFTHVFSSPLKRASKTCELAGYGDRMEIEDNLMEWDYGNFEGKRGKEIRKDRPGWLLFRDGAPGGESPEDVATRADRFIAHIRELQGDIVAFAHGHIIRMIAARWLGLPPFAARFFYCQPASVGLLAYEHDNRDEPIVRRWNYIRLLRE